MKLHLASDLHFDFYGDKGASFIDNLDPEGAEVLILAGDIDDGRFPDQWRRNFERLLPLYPHLIVVPGNHEYFNGSRASLRHTLREASKGLEGRVHVLMSGQSAVTIDGQYFIGGTMWYRQTPDTILGEFRFPDFRLIEDARDWIYEENAEFERELAYTLRSDDIVVTHHMPTMNSVAPQYRNARSNCFFVCEMDQIIEERKPKLWMHGHTHVAMDYMLGGTRIACNPRGYPGENFPRGSNLYKPLLIEV